MGDVRGYRQSILVDATAGQSVDGPPVRSITCYRILFYGVVAATTIPTTFGATTLPETCFVDTPYPVLPNS